MKCDRCGQKSGKMGTDSYGRLYLMCPCGHASPQAEQVPYDSAVGLFAKAWDTRYAQWLKEEEERKQRESKQA